MLKSLGINRCCWIQTLKQDQSLPPCQPRSQTGAQDTTAKCPPTASRSHPTHPAAPAVRGVLFIAPAGWGQAPSLSQSPPPGHAMVSLAKPGPYAYPRVPQGGAEGAATPIWTDSGRSVSSKGILSAITRKRGNEPRAGRCWDVNDNQS